MIDWADLERRNAAIGAFVDFDRGATAGAGPLAGMTIGIKSNIAIRGLPWTAGLALRRAVIAHRDAEVVARLRAAGAIILGTLNMHEAALGATTDNPWYGRTTNPHRAGYTAGGSSGGSGAAVAAGLCDAALGTDTLGSIRIPAAYNGIYGLKPTHGVVPDDGLVPLSKAFDAIGPLARSLDVLKRIWGVIAPAAASGGPIDRVVTLDEFGGAALQPAVRAAYDVALAALKLPVATLTLPAPAGAIRHAAFVAAAQELARHLGDSRERRPTEISRELTGYLAYAEGRLVKTSLLDEAARLLGAAVGSNGVLLLPTTPHAAFPHDTPAPADQADLTSLANLAGLPALSIPAGRDSDNLPVAVQLVGPAGSETALIALARGLDTTLGGFAPPPRN